MADQRILYTEKMVGANPPGGSGLSDTLNRLTLIEHNTDGSHMSWADVDTYGGLAGAVANFGTTPAAVYIKSSQALINNVTIPATLTVAILNTSGLITITAGKTLTINGPFSCGLFQCFSATGNVVFASAATEAIEPEWFSGGVIPVATIAGSTATRLGKRAPLDNPAFTTGIATPALTLGATAVTSTGTELNLLHTVTTTPTQFNYLNAATGKTGTGNVVFDTNPVLNLGITTQTGATYTVGASDYSIIANRAGTVTLTLGTPTIGRTLLIRTIQAQTVVSATSNVVPIAGGSATTAILSATAGKYALIQWDGIAWQIMMAN